MFNAFVLDFLFLVSVCSLNNWSCIVLCLYHLLSFFVNKTKWFSGLHLVVLFIFWLFHVHFLFFIPSKKPKYWTQQKKQKCRKKGQTKNTVSAVVFTTSVPNFLGGLHKLYFCWKHIKIGVSAYFEKGKKGPKCEKRLSQKSVQGWVKNQSKYVAQHNWTDFWLKRRYLFVFLFLLFFLLSHSPCRKKNIFEKKEERRIWTDAWIKKGIFGQMLDSTTYIYIYFFLLTHHHLGAPHSRWSISSPCFCQKMQKMLVNFFWRAFLSRWFLFFPSLPSLPPFFFFPCVSLHPEAKNVPIWWCARHIYIYIYITSIGGCKNGQIL